MVSRVRLNTKNCQPTRTATAGNCVLNGLVYCASNSGLKENLDMVNLFDHRLSMSSLHRPGFATAFGSRYRTLHSTKRQAYGNQCGGHVLKKTHGVIRPLYRSQPVRFMSVANDADSSVPVCYSRRKAIELVNYLPWDAL